MSCDEWIPSMYTNSSIKMVENSLIKLKEKLGEEDYLINFFENELLFLELKTLEIQTLMQNIRLTIVQKQNELVDLHKKVIKIVEEKNKSLAVVELKIKEKEYDMERLNLELIKNDFNLNQTFEKIERIKELIESRKENLFDSYNKEIKDYLIDEE